jgi:lysophospholipase L1-like esterase
MPDLFIVSFGTNESFSNIPAEKFINRINQLVGNIQMICPGVPVIVTTPPTSLFRNGELNMYAEEYSDALLQSTDIAVWDMYSFTGGLLGAKEKPEAIQITRDKIHYTGQGYINQGTALANAILHDYEIYKQLRRKAKNNDF